MSAFLVHPEFIGAIYNQLLWEKNTDSKVEDSTFLHSFYSLCLSFFTFVLYHILMKKLLKGMK